MGLQSFGSLADNLPSWIERLDLLSKQVYERHAEFAALAKSAVSTSTRSIRKEKTGSMESLKPRDEVDNIPEPPSTIQSPSTAVTPNTNSPVRIDINPESKKLFTEYRMQAKRKRASASMLSGTSGARKFRTRTSLHIYYDSMIQENFEWLVRNISSARNNLRKGKATASFKARMAGMGMEESPFGDRSEVSTRNPRLARLPRMGGKFQVGGINMEAFDIADKELEAAQSLCEIGAHQFLRDGLCDDELSGTRERFDKILKLAKEQKAIYEVIEQEKAEKEATDNLRAQANGDIAIDVDPTANSHANGHTNGSFSNNLEIDPVLAVDDSHKSNDIKVDSVAIASDLGIGPDGTIEIDDADDSASFHVDLSAFRKTRRR